MKKPMKKAPPKRGGTNPPAVAVPMSSPDDMKWKAEDALHTLKRAEEIRADPALMKHVQAHAMGQRDHLNKIIRKKVK